jgi:hypothetical protein
LIDVVSWVVTKRKDSEIFLLEMTLHKFYSKHFNAAAKKNANGEALFDWMKRSISCFFNSWIRMYQSLVIFCGEYVIEITEKVAFVQKPSL